MLDTTGRAYLSEPFAPSTGARSSSLWFLEPIAGGFVRLSNAEEGPTVHLEGNDGDPALMQPTDGTTPTGKQFVFTDVGVDSGFRDRAVSSTLYYLETRFQGPDRAFGTLFGDGDGNIIVGMKDKGTTAAFSDQLWRIVRARSR